MTTWRFDRLAPRGPVYEHDCAECLYLGTAYLDEQHFDFYRCIKGKEEGGIVVPWASFIARYGLNENYISIPEFIAEGIGALKCPSSKVYSYLEKIVAVYDSDSVAPDGTFGVSQNQDMNSVGVVPSPLLTYNEERALSAAIREVWPSIIYQAITPGFMAQIMEIIFAKLMHIKQSGGKAWLDEYAFGDFDEPTAIGNGS